MASSATLAKTPSSTHSSRRARAVVSETFMAQRRSAVTQLQPVTRRTRISSKTNRSEVLGRWQPSGWDLEGPGRCGSTAAKTASTTWGSSARMMVGHLHSVVGGLDEHPDHLGATTTTGGWSPALIRKYLTGPRAPAYPRDLLARFGPFR